MARAVTVTGGREATTRQITGDYALCVGVPARPAPPGWRWHLLADIARLESGHTPSRRHPEYWGGDIPWISLRDAKAHHGGFIYSTLETTNNTGIANSSSRVLPTGTVCLSRTASVGYVIVLAQAMATSQDFVNWTCSAELDPRFLQYLLIAEGTALRRFAAGAVHSTIYYPEVKAFHVCIPPVAEQKRIVTILDEAFENIDRATANTEQNLAKARKLFEALLGLVFRAREDDGDDEGKRWNRRALIDVADVFDGPHATPKTIDVGPIFLGISALNGGTLDLSETRHVSDQDFAKWTRRVRPRANDLVFSYETRLGQIAIVPEGLDCCLGRRMGLIRIRSKEVLSRFFMYQYLCPQYQEFLASRTIHGATVDRLSIKEFPFFPIDIPPLAEQTHIVTLLDAARSQSDKLIHGYTQKAARLAELKKSLLAKAFSGRLAKQLICASLAETNARTKTAEFGAKILLLAHHRHVAKGKEQTFGRVKAQKLLHVVESIGDIDLGRVPIKDVAGPNDSAHQRRLENWAKENKLFEFVKRGAGYEFRKLHKYDASIKSGLGDLAPYRDHLDKLIDLLVPMNSREAEVFATVHAAWNNLLRDGCKPTEEAIVRAAREEWHSDKLKIPRAKFVDAVKKIEKLKLVPKGSAKRVGGQESLL